MANLKRLWDTENKMIVWAIPTADPHKAYQVWTNDDGSKLYIYRNSQYIELDTSNSSVVEYGHVRKELDDQMVGYYLTDDPTNLYNWDSGDEVAYRFMNGTTILDSGKVDEGETPEYTGETPTKAATAQYTYTFSGWDPTVGPIYKKTDFKAQFTSTVNEYTVSISSNDLDYGTVDEPSVENVPYGTAISAEDAVLTIGTGTSAVEVTAIPASGYEFSTWGELPATVTGNTSITVTFVPEEYTFSIESNDETMGTVNVASVTASYGDSISASNNVLAIGETEVTATAETGYVFSGWTDDSGDPLPATAEGNMTIVAVFEAETPAEE